MKRSRRRTQTASTPKWAPLSRIKWRRGGLWWVFIPLSGAIAIFWKPIANPDTLNQMGTNISTNVQTFLSPLTPYINDLKDTLERAQTIDPVQPSLAQPEENGDTGSLSSTQSDLLSDSELQQIIAALSLEEIGEEINTLSSPSLSAPVSLDFSPSGNKEKKSPLSASHPLVSSVPYWSQKPAQPEPEEILSVSPTFSSSLTPTTGEIVESVTQNLPTDGSRVFGSNLTSTRQLPKTTLPNNTPQTTLNGNSSSGNLPSSSVSETRSFGYSRLSPFVDTSPESTPSNPFTPQTQFTAPAGSIRPRGYGLIQPTTSSLTVPNPQRRSLYPVPNSNPYEINPN
ncbi:hypothetical protein [Roseofilum sp. Guam]|uniref:hypothetical protein n=1 Tax=Roseofilum sp. Guam TaxID=2821502 RepID=UPI001B212A10|nr:hypothetical protein [Roseofilum sp. Guam]MBP0029386.1 hypothetical protein [Roseofilum sp. Guam]